MSAAQWTADVEAAAAAFDEVRLRALYTVGRSQFGAEFDQMWAATISGFDATAITG